MILQRRCHVRFGLVLFSISVLVSPVVAADVTLTVLDAFGASSFNTAGGWSNAAAPSAGNDYILNNSRLRTPADGNSYTFGGDSLRVNSTNDAEGGLMYKGTGMDGVLTIDNLILDGGWIHHQNGTGDLMQLEGNVNVASDSTIWAKQGNINVLAEISGSANLSIPVTDASGEDNRYVSFFGANSGYSGNLDIAGRFRLEENGGLTFDIGSSGVNNALAGTGTAAYNGIFSFDLAGASSAPGDSWTIASVANQSFGETFSVDGFTQSGDFWFSGSYLFNTTNGILSISEPPITWDVNGGGNWGTGANWLGGSAPTAGDEVVFGGVLTAENAPATISLNTPASISRVTFSNANQYELAGPNALTLVDLAQLSAGSGTHVVSANIVGTSGLTKTGGGVVILSGNNSYSGGTTVQAGTLGVRSTSSVPGAVSVDAGATLRFDGDAEAMGLGYDGTFAGNISGAGQVQLDSSLTSETVTFNNAKSYTGQTTVVGGTLQITGSGTLGASDGTAATRTLIDGNESTGKLALSGGVAIGSEVLVLEARELEALESVHLTSSGNNSWSGNIKGETGGTQYNLESTLGTLTLSGTISAPDTAVRDFVFDGAGNFNLTGALVDVQTGADGAVLPGPIDNTPTVSLFKRGTGTLTIGTASGDFNDYWHGGTTVEGGKLEVISNGSDDGELRSTTIAVQAGAAFDVDDFGFYSIQTAQDLSGAGEIHTQTLGVFGDSLLSPGDDGVGTLTLRGAGGTGSGDLFLGSDFFDDAGARGGLVFELGSATTVGGGVNDLITGVGNLTIDVRQFDDDFAPLGTDLPIEVLVTPIDGELAGGGAGNYRLINYTGSYTPLANSAVAFDVQLQGVTQTRQSLSVSTATPGQVNLVVSGSAANLIWAGNNGANPTFWDVNTTANWSNGGADVFFNLDNVTFNDTGSSTTVAVQSDVTPGSVTFNSASSRTYNLTGPGAIVGENNLTLSGNVTAALANGGTNNFGDASIAAGATLVQGNGVSTGNTFVNGSVSGAGSVRVESGSLLLGGDNTYTGVTTVNGGTLLMESATALGSASANTVVNGGTLRANGATFTALEPLTLNGGALAVGGGGPAALVYGANITVAAGGGTIQVDGNTGDDGLTVTSNIVGSAGGTLNANIGGGSTFTLQGNLTNNGTLNKNDNGILALTGTASITSPVININSGTLDVSGLDGTFVVASGQNLNNNSNNTVVGDVVAAGGSTVSGAGAFADNLTIQSGSVLRVGGIGLPTTPSQFLIDSFETYSVGNVVDVATPPWTDHGASGFADIEDDGAGNLVLTVGEGTGFRGASRGTTAAGQIAEGEVATFFFRVNSKVDVPNFSIGLADQVDTGGANFGDNEAQIRLFADEDATAGTFGIDARDGGAFVNLVQSLTTETWYNVWMVVDQGTDTMEVYLNTGNGDAIGANQIGTDLAFRNGTTALLNSILILAGNGVPQDNASRIDDLYYLDGVDLTNPLGGLSPVQIAQSETMTVQGDLTLSGGASLAMDVFSTSAHDSLNVSGNLEAAGALAVSLVSGAPTPALGDVFDLLDFATASGDFDSFSLPSLGSGLAWNVSDLLTTGELEVVVDVDLNNDGVVNGRDYMAILRTDLSLIPAWEANFGKRLVTPLAALATVPEPASWLCALAGLMVSLSARKRS